MVNKPSQYAPQGIPLFVPRKSGVELWNLPEGTTPGGPAAVVLSSHIPALSNFTELINEGDGIWIDGEVYGSFTISKDVDSAFLVEYLGMRRKVNLGETWRRAQPSTLANSSIKSLLASLQTNSATAPLVYDGGGAAAPKTGLWTFRALCTAATYPEDNGNDIIPDNGPQTEAAMIAVAYLFTIPVKATDTHTISADATIIGHGIIV